MSTLLQLGVDFALLSFFAFGGIVALLPQMQHSVVDEHHWMSPATFLQLFAIAQAAPGPNMLVVTLVGWHVAGIAGALVATVAICGPTSILIFGVDRLWSRVREGAIASSLRAGIAPVAVGLVLAGGVGVARGAGAGWASTALSAASLAVALLWRGNPLWLLGTGALLGLGGLI